jgi:uncharacterized protein (UPF0276 family)
MAALSVTYSEHLLDLAQEPAVNWHYIRLGNWLDQELVDSAFAQFPEGMFLYHHNGNIPHDTGERKEFVAYLWEWQQRTASPWLSLHLDFHTSEEIGQVIRGERQPPLYEKEKAFDLLYDGAQQVQSQIDVPLLLENMPSWPQPWPCPEADPGFITRLLKATDGGFLLDTAHARMAAGTFGQDVYAYLAALPLDRVVEIHVSSPRYRDNTWHSSHEVLEEQDYTILRWLLERTAPQAITLEYWQDREQIKDQLIQLDRLLSIGV